MQVNQSRRNVSKRLILVEELKNTDGKYYEVTVCANGKELFADFNHRAKPVTEKIFNLYKCIYPNWILYLFHVCSDFRHLLYLH